VVCYLELRRRLGVLLIYLHLVGYKARVTGTAYSDQISRLEAVTEKERSADKQQVPLYSAAERTVSTVSATHDLYHR